MDVRDLVAGSSLYLPVQVAEAGLFVGDPHYAQGHGEVALTALEAPLRATLRVTLLPAAQSRATAGRARPPVRRDAAALDRRRPAPRPERGVPQAVREALRVLKEMYDVPADLAYAYLSAAGDFVVSQVVDDVKGIHCLIRKADFARWV